MEVKVINKSKNKLPEYATSGSAGCDLMADFSSADNIMAHNSFITWNNDKTIIESVTIRPGGRALIPTNLFTAIPEGYEVQVRSRSGLAIKKGILVLNSPGTIDCDFRNGWGVILANFGIENFEIKQGDRIAQAILNKVEQITWKEVESLDDTDRGLGGFGSTGVSNTKSPNITAKEILEDNIESKSKNKSKSK
jgi:dUTP pyrophosphatase